MHDFMLHMLLLSSTISILAVVILYVKEKVIKFKVLLITIIVTYNLRHLYSIVDKLIAK